MINQRWVSTIEEGHEAQRCAGWEALSARRVSTARQHQHQQGQRRPQRRPRKRASQGFAPLASYPHRQHLVFTPGLRNMQARAVENCCRASWRQGPPAWCSGLRPGRLVLEGIAAEVTESSGRRHRLQHRRFSPDQECGLHASGNGGFPRQAVRTLDGGAGRCASCSSVRPAIIGVGGVDSMETALKRSAGADLVLASDRHGSCRPVAAGAHRHRHVARRGTRRPGNPSATRATVGCRPAGSSRSRFMMSQ